MIHAFTYASMIVYALYANMILICETDAIWPALSQLFLK